MNTSLKEIYNTLSQKGITPEVISLTDGATLLVFEYRGALRAITGTAPDLTLATGRTIAHNKSAASYMASMLGLPLPVTETYETLSRAVRFMKKWGTIVVKPADGAHGNGVSTGVKTDDELQKAVERAQHISSQVLLQQEVYGKDIRVLVIGGKVAAATERVPASVVGDGTHTISELIDIENKSNPDRGYNYKKRLNVIDKEASVAYLGDQLSRVLPEGEHVQVVGAANIGSGGSAIARTNDLPPAMLRQAEKFSQSVGLFTAGVDFMYDQETENWYFIEANTSPSFGLHLWPSVGEGIDVAAIFVDRLLEAYDQASSELQIVGRDVAVDIVGHAEAVPAKVDTGADSSSIWASNISVDEAGMLEFTLFDKQSPLYTGKVNRRKQFKAVLVRSSNGQQQVRYKVPLSLRVAGKRVRATFTLADRSRNWYPILIGRRTLRKKFLVDVDRHTYTDHVKKAPGNLNERLLQDPHKFHQEHYTRHNQQSGAPS